MSAVLLILIGVVFFVGLWFVVTDIMSSKTLDASDLVPVIEAGSNELVLAGIAVFFLISIERRIKRRRALRAIHELRAIAHVIDMHQLTKDPATFRNRLIDTPSSPHRTLNTDYLVRYLDYSSELLSLTGKLAALYIQRFDDELTLTAANDVENLTTQLSRKIWQKVLIAENSRNASSTT